MLSSKPPALPSIPACADCLSSMQLAQQGAAVEQYPSRIFRSVDGRMRSDFGDTSVITDPNTGKAILLDHIKKEARHIPAPPPMPQMPMTPRMPSLPGMTPPTPPANIKDLGTSMIDGHEVVGTLFTFHPPTPPATPGIPSPPAVPQMPITTEMWLSKSTQLAVLTKTTGSFGQHICQCRIIQTEPPPAQFQIPPDYKQISGLNTPTPPAVPTVTPPTAPTLAVPNLAAPQAPTFTPPAVPKIPGR